MHHSSKAPGRAGIVALAVAPVLAILAGCEGKVVVTGPPPPVTAPGFEQPVPAPAPDAGSTDAGEAAPPPAPAAGGRPSAPGASAIDCSHRGSGTDYPVGPGKKYASIGDVPFETLKGGDTVRIFWRPEPYREKMMISGQGTAEQPVRVCGVAGPRGEQPVIDGKDATTRPQLRFPYDGHQPRGLIIIGHKNGDTYELTPKHIVLEGLEVRNASPPNSFKDKAGQVKPYTQVVAGIFVQRAENLTIRGCTVTQNNNGIFMGTGGGVELTKDVLIEGNHIHGNGNVAGDREHNLYNEVSNITYQYNRFGPTRVGAGGISGSNIKDRSAGVVIRYNWIEDGAHLIDLVDAQEAAATTVPMPSFHATYVYGNVMIRGKTASGSMIHYGGDSGEFKNYRKGTLYFYNNTLVVKNENYIDYQKPAVFQISTNDERLVARNNIFHSTVTATSLRPVILLGARDQVSSGMAVFSNNWVTKGWTPFDPTPGATVAIKAKVTGLEASTWGTAPGFKQPASDDYELADDSPCRTLGAPLTARDVPETFHVSHQYVKHAAGRLRRDSKGTALGALGK
jgi:parallel beta-helix repeat protein